MSRKTKYILLPLVCLICAAGGFAVSAAMPTHVAGAGGPTTTQLVNAFIDNLLTTASRLLDLPLFAVLAVIVIFAFIGAFLVGRFAVRGKKMRWGFIALAVLVSAAVFGAALVTDRRLEKLQAQVNDLRSKTNTDRIALLNGGNGPATKPAAPDVHASMSPGNAATKPLVKANATRTDFIFDQPAAQKNLEHPFSDVTMKALVYDQASDVVQVHIGMPLNQAYIAIVDLTCPGVKIKLGGSLDKKTLTSAFAKENDCGIAINGEAGIAPVANAGLGTWQGYMVKEGKALLHEQPNDPRPFLAFDKDNHPSFIPAAASSRDLLPTMYNVLWGRLDAVIHGAVQTADERNRQPRTAMGINADGSRLYLMVVDGRQSQYSLGFTRQEVGDFLKSFGASDGMLCDEGGSSCIYMGKFGGIVNIPSDNQGDERPTYTHFGISYKP